MKQKLKVNDVAVFEYTDGYEFMIGYVDYWGGFGLVIIADESIGNKYKQALYFESVKHITYIGKL